MLLAIRRARLEAGLPLTVAAKQVGVGAQTLARIETGRELPWPAIRKRLAALYRSPESVLFHDIDQARESLRRAAGRLVP